VEDLQNSESVEMMGTQTTRLQEELIEVPVPPKVPVYRNKIVFERIEPISRT